MGSSAKPLKSESPSEWSAGMRAKGEFRCRGCGYGVTVYRSLPPCPMCQTESWERVPWRPYTRSYAAGQPEA